MKAMIQWILICIFIVISFNTCSYTNNTDTDMGSQNNSKCVKGDSIADNNDQRYGDSTTFSNNNRMEMKLVVFSVYYPYALYDEAVLITGNIGELGMWDPQSAIELDPATWPYWKASLEISAGQTVKYRYFLKRDNVRAWETGDLRQLTVPYGQTIYRKNDVYHY